MKVTLKMDAADKVLLKRSLNKNGKAQRHFTHEVRRLAEPYIPFKTGNLANDEVSEHTDRIEYYAPYAKKQYNENRGQGLRGKMWIPRMWADRGKEIVKSVADYVGGKAK